MHPPPTKQKSLLPSPNPPTLSDNSGIAPTDADPLLNFLETPVSPTPLITFLS